MTFSRQPFVKAEVANPNANNRKRCGRLTLFFLVILITFNLVLLIVFLRKSSEKEEGKIDYQSKKFEQFLWRLKNPFRNLTAHGNFYIRRPDGSSLKVCKTSWIQDDFNRKLKITIGVVGTTGWIGEYYFFKHGTFVVTPFENDNVRPSAFCTFIRDWNYTDELLRYDLNLNYEGKRLWKSDTSFNIVHVFSGIVNKTNSREVVQRFVEEKSSAPIVLRRIPVDDTPHGYTEFIYDLDKISTDQPTDQSFTVPSICFTS